MEKGLKCLSVALIVLGFIAAAVFTDSGWWVFAVAFTTFFLLVEMEK